MCVCEVKHFYSALVIAASCFSLICFFSRFSHFLAEAGIVLVVSIYVHVVVQHLFLFPSRISCFGISRNCVFVLCLCGWEATVCVMAWLDSGVLLSTDHTN